MIDHDRRYLFLSVISFSATVQEIKHNCVNLYKMPACKRKDSCLTLTGRYFSRVVLLRSDLWNLASTGYRVGLSRSYCTCCIFNLDNVIDFDSVLFDQISDQICRVELVHIYCFYPPSQSYDPYAVDLRPGGATTAR